MIPDAAVEVAAKAMYANEGLSWDEGMVPDWESEDDSLQNTYRTDARLVLEAAAPHMLAYAWSTCAVESARCGLLSAADALLLANRNPYRHTP